MIRVWWVSASNSSWGRCPGARLSRKVTWWGLSRAGHSHITRANAHGITLLDIIFFFFSFIWLCRILNCACRIFSCGMWDAVPQPGIKPGPPALGAWSPRNHQGCPWTSFKTPTIYPWPYQFSLIISEFLTRMWSLSMDPCTWFSAFVHVPTGGILLLVLSAL